MALSSARRERLTAAGQGHALARLDALPAARRARLEAELERLDLTLLAKLHALTEQAPTVGSDFEPPDVFPLERDAENEERARAAERHGQELLRAGKVGYVLVAGGQASRLGYDAPKGAFPIGPVTERTLFAYHAQRLLAAQARYGRSTPWYIMTSPANDADTRTIFADNAHFGLDPSDVFFFSQDTLPALDPSGRVLFADEDQLFSAPNGHGGCLIALSSSGAIDDMRARGIEQLSYFQVDNPLVRPADPLFIGLHAQAGAGMSTKVVAKRDADERVGVIGRIDGAMGCIEYSDLPEDKRHAPDATGALRFRAGNIAVHVLAIDFLADVVQGELRLPWHVAKKRMAVLGDDGRTQEVDGFKFEAFVFDALASSPISVTLEVDRALEFSPVKNGDGEDSPATSRAALARMFADWVGAAGGVLPAPGEEGFPPVEVDPRYADTQDEFAARGAPEPNVRPTGHVYEL